MQIYASRSMSYNLIVLEMKYHFSCHYLRNPNIMTILDECRLHQWSLCILMSSYMVVKYSPMMDQHPMKIGGEISDAAGSARAGPLYPW